VKRIYQPRVRTLLRIADTTNVADTRGRAFEILCCYLLGSVPGLRVVARDEVDFFESEEIDLMVTNDHDPDGLWFLNPRFILVECKNWSRPVGSQEVAWFDRKLQDRHIDFGILVAANGITGIPNLLMSANHVIADALRDGREIIVVTRREMEAVTSSDDIVELLKDKQTRLKLKRTSLE